MNRYKLTFEPGDYVVDITEGTTIREAIITAGLDFDFPCGGRGACGKCRIKILDKDIPVTEKDKRILGEKELTDGVRLACQTVIHKSMAVQLGSNMMPTYNILMSNIERIFTIEPLINKYYIEVELPTLYDQKSDLKRLKEKLFQQNHNFKNLKIQLPVLRDLPDKIREAKHRITVISDGKEILGIEKGNTQSKLLGVALDIGTTTLVAYLMDLHTGKELAVASSLNPQVKFGADVISRTTYANKNKDSVNLMQKVVIKLINQLIGDMVENSIFTRVDVYAVTIVGNTCMHHLFMGLTPRYIAALPYVPVISEAIDLSSVELQIHINPAGRVFILPNIAGFVGADTVGVILATEIDRSSEIKLAIDIGTNGEIVLGSIKKLVACSTAAGPAFEGAQISSGMRGAVGAIDHVHFGETLTYTVVGNEKPRGICGSGLMDIIAGFVKIGIVNKRGKLLSPDRFIKSDAKVFAKNIITYNETNAFLLVPGTESAHGRPIMITQNDIISLQLAKGAISAGIRILLEEVGITTDDIQEVLLAGAFGNYMDPHSACVVGLIPLELESKIKMVGNAAGTGSKLALLSRSEYQRANTIASNVKYIELGAQKRFNIKFAEGMRFIIK